MIHSWPFAHDLVVVVYVMALGFPSHYCVSLGDHIAMIHGWPFTHEVMMALYVITLRFMCHCCISRF